MNTKYTRLQLSIGKAADVAKELFNVTGKIVQLNGEIDFNYKIYVKTYAETARKNRQ